MTVLLLIGVPVALSQLPGGYSTPPTPAECAEDWNAIGNSGVRREVARSGFDLAIVEGSEAKGVFGYCGVHLERPATSTWITYSRWVYGYEGYVPSPTRWGPDDVPWEIDPSLPDPSPRVNAAVSSEGTIRLLGPRV